MLPRPNMLDGDPYAPLHVSVVMEGPLMFVSRRVAALPKELFVERFPGIARGDIDVYAVAREPGVRSKVALDTDDEDPDFIYKLMGDGATIQQIVADTGDPIIDVISVDPEPAQYVTSALATVEIVRIGVHEPTRELALVIADGELDRVEFQLACDLVRWTIAVRYLTAFEAGGWETPAAAVFRPRTNPENVLER